MSGPTAASMQQPLAVIHGRQEAMDRSGQMNAGTLSPDWILCGSVRGGFVKG